jgi:hypothetical protein
MRFALFFLRFLTFVTVTGCYAADDLTRPLTKTEWVEDLHYLARELPKRHVDPFREQDEATFREAVRNLDSRLDELQGHQIQIELGRLVAMIGKGDGHTELYLPREGRGFRRLPVALALFGDELRVYASLPDHEDLLGTRVVTIGGIGADEAYRRVLPLIAHDNEVEFKRSAPIYLSITEVLHAMGLSDDPAHAIIDFEGADGAIVQRTLEGRPTESLAGADWVKARSESDTPLYAQRFDENYWFKWLENKRTIYVSYRRCQNQKDRLSIKRFARELFAFVDEHPVDRFVLDLRNNRGGNYNLSDPLVKGIRESEKINRPGSLFVILGRESFSAGVVTAIRLKRETAALLVGEPPRSRPNGTENYEWMHLPNSRLRIDYTDRLADHWPELGDAPLVPIDVAVENSFEDYRTGRDQVLETILEHGR